MEEDIKKRREILENLKYGEIIRYSDNEGNFEYIVVKEIKKERIRGQIATPVGVNSISIEELANKGFSIPSWLSK